MSVEVPVGFPQSVLSDDENVVLHLRPHWKALVAPTIWVLLGAAVVAASWVLVPFAYPFLQLGITVAVAVLLIVVSFRPWLIRQSTHYVFTTERVLMRTGVFSRNGRDIPLSRINDVSFSHGLLDRMLGCGTLTIESAGERGQVVLADLPRVEKTQTTLYELVENDRDRYSGDRGQR